MAAVAEPLSKQLDPRAAELEVTALTWPEKAKGVTIADQTSYDQACEMILAIKGLRNEAEEHHRPIITSAHQTHKLTLAALAKVDTPLAEAERILKASIGGYEQEQRRIQADLERQAREKAEREQAEQLEAQIEEAEAAGASQEEVLAIIEQPMVAPAPIVPQVHTAAKGVSTSKTYKAEVFNLRDLCRAIADGKQPTTLIEANMPALNGIARALKGQMSVPGVRAVEVTNVSVRGR